MLMYKIVKTNLLSGAIALLLCSHIQASQHSVTSTIAKQELPVHIYTMGDSLLDNHYWLTYPKQDTTQQLKDKHCFKSVQNYAVDEAEFAYIREGIVPYNLYYNARKRNGMSQYPCHREGKVYPLENLKEHTAKYNKDRHVVLLSIGGNDCIDYLKGDDFNKIREEVTSFEAIYDEILNGIEQIAQENKTQINIILHMPYMVYHKNCLGPILGFWDREATFFADYTTSFDEEDFKRLFVLLFNQIASAARKHKCDIIDLSRTFNPFDRKDYGHVPHTLGWLTTPIEPSNQGVSYIVNLACHAVAKKDTNQDIPYIYYGKRNQIQCEENNESIEANYIEFLTKHRDKCAYDQQRQQMRYIIGGGCCAGVTMSAAILWKKRKQRYRISPKPFFRFLRLFR